jgi:hypothetical protein
MNHLLKIVLTFAVILIPSLMSAQLNGLSGGLVFSSGVDFNIANGLKKETTANPGIYGKGYLKINKKLNIVPSIIAFKPYTDSDINSYKLKTYMFQGDIDCTYGIAKDKNIRLFGYAGFNASAVMMKSKILAVTSFTKQVRDYTEVQPGLNLGAALQLYVNDAFDGYITAKYVLSRFDQVVINIGAIYYPGGKHRKGSW